MHAPTYELIKKLEELDFFSEILTAGIVSMNWIDYKVIYEHYGDEVKIHTKDGKLTGQELRRAKRTAKTATADKFRVSESSVYKIIQGMES